MNNVSKSVWYCVFVFGIAVVFAGPFILLGKDKSPVIGKSSKQVFLDVAKGDACAPLSRYSVFPTSAPSVEVPGLVKEFHWFCKLVLSKRYVPDVKFVGEHVKCVSAKALGATKLKEDVAYLRYSAGTRQVLVAQTGGIDGKVYVFVSDDVTDKTGKAQRVVCWKGVFREADIVSQGPSVGVIFDKHNLVARAKGGVPANDPLADEWFSWLERRQRPSSGPTPTLTPHHENSGKRYRPAGSGTGKGFEEQKKPSGHP